MKRDFTINYLKNSATQVLATVVGMLSLFIVVPFLSENKILYGIYSVCISLNIFFNHADFGFLSAGQKYAGEFYAQGNLREEERIVSFTSFVILLFVITIGICLFPFVLKPDLLITELDLSNKSIATGLIAVLIISAPFIAIKRVCLICYTCRIEQYKYQVVTLIGHIIKILSILYFFGREEYKLLEYFIFVQVVDVFCTFLLIIYIVKRYDYSINNFLKSFKFDSKIWRLVKGLVGASLVSTISWILFYEIDLIVLAKITSPEMLAVYSAAFTLLSFSRSYFAVIYSSFSARYNHYVGMNNLEGLKLFFVNNVIILFPFSFFPILVFQIIGDPFILSWVGEGYEQSVLIAKILYSGSFLAFISYPSGQYLFATNRVNAIYISSIMLPFIFWIGVIITYPFISIVAFAVFKAISQVISAIYSFYKSAQGMRLSIKTLSKGIIRQYWMPVLLAISISVVVLPYMSSGKSFNIIFINILLIGGILLMVLLSCIYFSFNFRDYTQSFLNRIRG